MEIDAPGTEGGRTVDCAGIAKPCRRSWKSPARTMDGGVEVHGLMPVAGGMNADSETGKLSGCVRSYGAYPEGDYLCSGEIELERGYAIIGIAVEVTKEEASALRLVEYTGDLHVVASKWQSDINLERHP